MADSPVNEELVTSGQLQREALRFVSDETKCPYLPGRNSRNEAYFVSSLDAVAYERLLHRGFRRSGRTLYRPRCRNCDECRSLRVLVDRFTMSRSQRRVRRRNADVRVTVDEPIATRDKFSIYERYLDAQHDDTMARTFESFVEFLYDSPLSTREYNYRLGKRLIGVSIVDVCPEVLSSVYMFFDPEFCERSLGTFSILWEIEHARRLGLKYYYLGYYIAGCRTMAYKSRFLPHEMMVARQRWITLNS